LAAEVTSRGKVENFLQDRKTKKSLSGGTPSPIEHRCWSWGGKRRPEPFLDVRILKKGPCFERTSRSLTERESGDGFSSILKKRGGDCCRLSDVGGHWGESGFKNLGKKRGEEVSPGKKEQGITISRTTRARDNLTLLLFISVGWL